MERRIAPPKDYEALLDRLTEPLYTDGPTLFGSKQKALMFAAALGYSLSRRQKLERKGTAIRFDIFENALDDGFVSALAISETKGLQVLGTKEDDTRATIFEEYAHAGLEEIQRRCFITPGDPLQVLIGLTEDALHPADVEIPGIDPNLLKDLAG